MLRITDNLYSFYTLNPEKKIRVEMQEESNKKLNRSALSVVINKTCIKVRLLHTYTHTKSKCKVVRI